MVLLSRSNDNIRRRKSCGLGCRRRQYEYFGIHTGTDNLLEDVAGWGIARRFFLRHRVENGTLLFAAPGDGGKADMPFGPKMTYSLAYKNYNMTVENAIGTWTGERMKET